MSGLKRPQWVMLLGAVVVVTLLLLAPRAPAGATDENAARVKDSPTGEPLSSNPRVAAILAQLANTEAPMPVILQLRKLAEQEPDNTEAQWNLGLLSWQTGQYDKAMERFLNVTRLAPEAYPDAYVFLARAYASLDSLDAARSAITTYKTLVTDTALLNGADQFLDQLNQHGE